MTDKDKIILELVELNFGTQPWRVRKVPREDERVDFSSEF